MTDVTMQDVDFDLNTSLISGNVDAVIGTYINHEYPALQKEGYDVTYFDITKEGCPDYEELVLVTGENQSKTKVTNWPASSALPEKASRMSSTIHRAACRFF